MGKVMVVLFMQSFSNVCRQHHRWNERDCWRLWKCKAIILSKNLYIRQLQTA